MSRVLFAIVLLLCGCYSAGVRVTEQQARQFEVGKTTYAEVVKALGEPTTVHASSDGSRMAMYTFASAAARPASFIPYVGLFAGGANVKHAMTTFRFDAEGKLVDYTTTDTAIAGQRWTTEGARTPRDAEPDAAATPAPLSVACSESGALRCNGAAVETCDGKAWSRSDACAAGQECSESKLYCRDGACCR